MSTFKIASWNVNSLRVRLPHVLTWLEEHKPDVLALQETKLLDEDFPFSAFEQLGYSAVAAGQKAYNGVAVISRLKATAVTTNVPELDDPQRRIMATSIGAIRILNLYVPNGESIVSEKYSYKLNWLSKLNNFMQQELAQHSKFIVLGDFNIAPADIDVHNPALWSGQVLFSAPERQAFQDWLQIGLTDCYRELNPTENSYSWWDYRMNAFKRNLGLRIDHILASKEISAVKQKCYIDKLPRSWDRPSDHAPIIAEFNI